MYSVECHIVEISVYVTNVGHTDYGGTRKQADNCLLNYIYERGPEYHPIQHRHKNDECEDKYVGDETNRPPYWSFYGKASGTNFLEEIVEVVSVKRRLSKFGMGVT